MAARREVERVIGELYKDDEQLMAHLVGERARIECEMVGADVGPRKRKKLQAEAAAFEEDIKKVEQRIQAKTKADSSPGPKCDRDSLRSSGQAE